MLGTREITGTGIEDSTGIRKSKGGGFQTFGLTKDELKSVLGMGYNVPTPIQRKSIPTLMQGTDVVAMARTGSGKTAAFAIPMIHKLEKHCVTVGIRGIVMSPTRELSLQIMRNMQKLSKHTDLRFCALVGGNSLDAQFARLAENPDVVIATPGRLLHIMEDAKMQLTRVQSVVLDEADRLFELGLQAQITAILTRIPEEAQRALFSATMPSVLAEFTEAKLNTPVVIRLDSEVKLSDKLKQSAFVVRVDEKFAALLFILRRIINVTKSTDQALVFVESRHHVEYIVALLQDFHYRAVGVHGNMDQEARKLNVEGFSRRKTSIMVVTDVAARGLDLPLLDNVINWSFPPSPKLFVHRVGRVARAGRTGSAYSLVTLDDMPHYVDLMRFLGRPLKSRPASDGSDALLFFSNDGCYGRLPELQLQEEVVAIHEALQRNEDLSELKKVADRAHGKFMRTLSKASRDGIKEARAEGGDLRFENISTHPIFGQDDEGKARIEQEDAVKALRQFKANETYLEMVSGEGRLFQVTPKHTLQSLRREEAKRAVPAPSAGESVVAAREAGKPLSLADRLLAKAQDRKRERDVVAADESTTAAAALIHKNRERLITGGELTHNRPDFRDSEFWVEDTKRQTIEDAAYSVRDATVNMGAETAAEAAQQRNVFMWNKKKNRYVKVNANDAKALMKGMKNESGKAIDFKAKLEAYSKWVKSSNLRIQDCGEQEDTVAITRAKRLAKGDEANDEDEDTVDISDPNNGKKLRVGRKLKRLPKEGKVRNFQELQQHKREEAEKRAKNRPGGRGKRDQASRSTGPTTSLKRSAGKTAASKRKK